MPAPDLSRSVTIEHLLDIARGLDAALNSEYARGIAELLAEASGMSVTDEGRDIILAHLHVNGENDSRLTKQATWVPARDNIDEPYVTIAGVMVFVYLAEGKLRVSVDVDDQTYWPGPVPMELCVGDATVYEATQTGAESAGIHLRAGRRPEPCPPGHNAGGGGM